MSLGYFLERARRRADSTLIGISDRAFEEALARLEADVAAEEEPRPVVDELDVLVLA